MLYLALVVCVFMLLAGYQSRLIYQRHRLETLSWDEIVAKLVDVDRGGLLEIADLYLNPKLDQLRIEPAEMWRTVGGLSGLGSMYNNAEVMLDLARYAERWNDENGRVISEMMRRDAMRVKRAVMHVQLTHFLQVGLVRSPFHLQEAISSYWLMRGRLMGLYAGAHAGLLPRLEAAL